MQVPSANKPRRFRISEKEVEIPQALEILVYIAVNNAKSRILKNGAFSVSGIKLYRKLTNPTQRGGDFRAFPENAPKSDNGKKLLIEMNFKKMEERDDGMEYRRKYFRRTGRRLSIGGKSRTRRGASK